MAQLSQINVVLLIEYDVLAIIKNIYILAIMYYKLVTGQ